MHLEMFLQALESAAELQSLKCVAVVLRTNRTATRRSTRLWRSSRRSRSFLAPAPLLLPLHPNPAPCLQEHPGAQPHPHPHPQVSHRLLSTLWGLSCNLCCLHTNTHLLPTPPPTIPCRGQVQHVRLCSVSALPVLQQPTSVRRLRRPLPPQSFQSQSQERESNEEQRRCDESDASSFLLSSFLLGFTFSLPPSLQRSAVSVASPRSTPSASPASRGCV